MKVMVFSINTTAGIRYGLKNASTGNVLHNATAKWKTERGAAAFAKRNSWEVVK